MKDGKYLTAKDKELILKGFNRLIDGGFQRSHFTQKMYKHLSLHFGFIAHFNIDGFFANRFADPEGRSRTLQSILTASHWTFNDDNTSGTGDLNLAIRELFKANADEIAAGAKGDHIKNLKFQQDSLAKQIKELETLILYNE